jgi:hypothetical protein
VSVSAGNIWSMADDLVGGLEEDEDWTLPQKYQEENNNKSKFIFSEASEDEEQVTLNLPMQWTILLENLNNSQCKF